MVGSKAYGWDTDSICQISNFLFLVQTSLFFPIHTSNWLLGPLLQDLPTESPVSHSHSYLHLFLHDCRDWHHHPPSTANELPTSHLWFAFWLPSLTEPTSYILLIPSSHPIGLGPIFFSLSLNYCNNCVSVSVLLALTYHVITLLKILSRASPLPKVKILSL